MARKEHQDLTATELNAIVYRYLQNSGFVHTAFNFFYEAGLGKADIEGMKIPPHALIRIVYKGLQFIELEANSEVGNDEEYHIFDTLDLITSDLDELKRKITSFAKLNSVENDKEQKNDSVETDKGQKIGSAETTTTARIQPMQQTKAQGMDATEQSISAAETAQETAATSERTAGTTATRRRWQLERRGTILKLKRQKD